MSVEGLEVELARIQSRIDSMVSAMDKIKPKLAKKKSLKFIEENCLTKRHVQSRDGEGVPYFNTIFGFGDWVVENTDKKWLCWNGLIYESSEIVAKRMARDAMGCYRHLPD